jgi:hypothetical protein
MNSFNHYSLGSCGEYLFSGIGGIRPASPGFKTILIDPVIRDGLTWANTRYDSIHGAIAPEISLVIPCYNEEGNLRELVKAIRESVEPLEDFLRNRHHRRLQQGQVVGNPQGTRRGDPRIRVQKFAFNCGESAASFAGLKAARGKYLFTLDADLQNDPKDLPNSWRR